MDKGKLLTEVAQKIKICQRCSLYKTAIQAVPGEGNPEAKIMFIGEAPGFWEDQRGKPFVGAAGKLLGQSLSSINLKRSDVFIANILKHRPPDNRDPLPSEVEACASWLDTQIEIIKPKIIATLGRFSMKKFIPGEFISQVHGQPRWVEFGKRRYLALPLYHPAAALRNGKIMSQFKKDFEKLSQLKDNLEKETKELNFGDFKKESQKKANKQLNLI